MTSRLSRFSLKLIRSIRLTNPFGYIFGCFGAGAASAWMLVTVFGRFPHHAALVAALPFAIGQLIPVTLSILATFFYWYKSWNDEYKLNKAGYEHQQERVDDKINEKLADPKTGIVKEQKQVAEGAADNKFTQLVEQVHQYIVQGYFIDTAGYGVVRSPLRTKQVGTIQAVTKILEASEMEVQDRHTILQGCLSSIRDQAQTDHRSHSWFGLFVGQKSTYYGLTRSNLVQAIDKACPTERDEGAFVADGVELPEQLYGNFRRGNSVMMAPVMQDTLNSESPDTPVATR